MMARLDTAARTIRCACHIGLCGLAMMVLGVVLGGSRHEEGRAFATAGHARVLAEQQVRLRGTSGEGIHAGAETGAAWRSAVTAVWCGVLGAGLAAFRPAAIAEARKRGPTSVRALQKSDAEQAKDAGKVARLAVRTEGTPQLVTDVDPSKGPEGTYQVGIDFATWLQSAQEEVEVDGLRVEGNLPAWLRGSWVHAGPAKFEFGDDEFVDWVDGQAMLYRVQIQADGKCQYKNKWLDTWNHRMHREAGRIAVRETCSRPSLPNILDRLGHLFSPPNNENGNLHVSQFAGGSRCISMSVGSALLEFGLSEMNTYGKVPFDDELSEGGPLIFHAEPHMDYKTGEWYSVAVHLRISQEHMGLKPEYVVFSIPADQPQEPQTPVKRRLLTRVQTEYPSPVHTIALTEKYLVMIQIPYPLNWDGMMNAEGKWLLTGEYEGNLNDYNTWEPHRPTLIRLIDKETGEELPVFETDPFFFFHVINSFEEKGGPGGKHDCVFLDVVCYNEPPVGFPLRQARSGDVEDWRGGGGEVRRFCMDLTTGECSWTGWPDNCFDEPKINPKVDGVRHRYSWGVIDDNGMLRLTKQDHDTHEVRKWDGQDTSRELPWQPVFVPEPYSDREDAGVLLSYVRDQPTGNNFAVVLNAETMEEQARIHFPEGHHIPLHGHGTWMQGEF